MLLHTRVHAIYICVPMHTRWSPQVLFVTKDQGEFTFDAKSLQGFDSILQSAL